MKISYLIFSSFLFILLLFSITTYINYRQSQQVSKNTAYLTRSSSVVRESNRYLRNILGMTNAGRGYLLTGDKIFLDNFKTTTLENETILAEILGLVNSDKQRKHLQQIGELSIIFKKEFFELFDQTKKPADPLTQVGLGGKSLTRSQTNFETEALQKLQRSLRNFINEEYQIREEQKAILAKSIQTTSTVSFSLTLFSIIVGLIIAAVLAQKISRRILNMVELSHSIAHGNYNVHLKDNGTDELSKLSKSLNHMANVLAENFTTLKRKNEELDQFAHIVSHDLKAPLRGIGNVITWIEEDHSNELSPKVHEYFNLINGRLARAENLIKGILSYARTETKSMERQVVAVEDLVSEIIENMSIPNSISIQVEKNLPTLYTEKLPLLQVMSNLIDNAIKYQNKPAGAVMVYHEEHDKFYQFFVEDNGPGIAPGHQQKIFKIFQTLQDRDSFESTGVGLAIVQKILDTRKEKINVYSELGNGTKFAFTWKK